MAQILAPMGAHAKKTIVGRGHSSHGRRCGRGNNGQNARSGGGVRPGFEGGQMPLYRRVARRGFSNYPFKEEFVAVSLDLIQELFDDNAVVSQASLKEKGVLCGKKEKAKILNGVSFSKKIVVDGVKMSKSAQEKVVSLGGEVK